VLRRDDPNLSSKLGGDAFENLEAGCLEAVVIGDKNAIQHSAAPNPGGSNIPSVFLYRSEAIRGRG
jgi:hypothetical protein